MNTIFSRYLSLIGNKDFMTRVVISIVLLLTSFVISFYAAIYATDHISNSVTDIVLNNIRVYDVDLIFIYGSVLFWVFISILILLDPKKIPFTLKNIALFTVVRSGFISLTHIGPFPTHVFIDPASIMAKFTAGGDLFFSGHTGLPFLMALVFWDSKKIRIFCLITSVVFGVVVLAGHLHYSIDVLAAFFITHTIYYIGMHIFKKDKQYFDTGRVA